MPGKALPKDGPEAVTIVALHVLSHAREAGTEADVADQAAWRRRATRDLRLHGE